MSRSCLGVPGAGPRSGHPICYLVTKFFDVQNGAPSAKLVQLKAKTIQFISGFPAHCPVRYKFELLYFFQPMKSQHIILTGLLFYDWFTLKHGHNLHCIGNSSDMIKDYVDFFNSPKNKSWELQNLLRSHVGIIWQFPGRFSKFIFSCYLGWKHPKNIHLLYPFGL